MCMKRSIVVLIVCVLFAGACTTKREIPPAMGSGPESIVRPGIEGSTGSAAGDRSSSLMDRLQEDLQYALAGSENMSFKRARDSLVLIFSSDGMFGFDSAAIKAGARAEISQLAEVLDRYPQLRIRIEGHTDSIGSAKHNQKLSEGRADAVRKALISLGMRPENIEIVGFGAVRPVASNKTPDGRPQNRRVKLVIMPVRERL
jgi:outer membrane protein OmpA-like peptidoglycan-associated protein